MHLLEAIKMQTWAGEKSEKGRGTRNRRTRTKNVSPAGFVAEEICLQEVNYSCLGFLKIITVFKKCTFMGTSLVVHAPTAGGLSFDPWSGN